MLGWNHWVRRALPWSVKRVFRHSLKQGRHVHLSSGTPGRTVWAQSRQTNRPSLWAIIGLKSMPTMQCGQRMIRIVSVGNCRSCAGQRKLARGIPDGHANDPVENQKDRCKAKRYRIGTRAGILAKVPTGGHAEFTETPIRVPAPGAKRKGPRQGFSGNVVCRGT